MPLSVISYNRTRCMSEARRGQCAPLKNTFAELMMNGIRM